MKNKITYKKVEDFDPQYLLGELVLRALNESPVLATANCDGQTVTVKFIPISKVAESFETWKRVLTKAMEKERKKAHAKAKADAKAKANANVKADAKVKADA